MTAQEKLVRISDMTIGLTATHEATIDADTVSEYARLTGDHNPVHGNDEYASTTRFGHRIAHGLLVASYVQTALTKLVAPGGVSTGYQFTLLAPVHIGSRIQATATCAAVDSLRRRATFKFIVTTQPKATLAISGEAIIAFPREREQA
jgi:3-hydroxybutyryl-CoA dehydratase